MYFQTTIKKPVECSGIALHSGKKVNLKLSPAPPNTGIVFRRTDLGNKEIPAPTSAVRDVTRAVTLKRDGAEVKTVEHLLAAFYGLRVDNIFADVDADEMPILDGSAAPFCYLIHEGRLKRQTVKRPYVRVLEPIEISTKGRRIAVYPSSRFKVTYTIVFPHPLIQRQEATFDVTPRTFKDEIAPARTFGFLKEVETLRKAGLALGGSLKNAIVLSETDVLNEKLRFKDEFVRHKLLDLLGDISLLGLPIIGHVVAFKGGHELHNILVERIRKSEKAIEIGTLNQGGKFQPIDSPALPRAVSLACGM